MRPFPVIRLVPLAAVLLAASAGAQNWPSEGRRNDLPHRRPALGPCSQPDLPDEARCTTVRVPENRAQPDGRQIALNVVVIPALRADPAREAITFFGGGPGQAATEFAGYMVEKLALLRGDRDLLFIDQRGTGGSNPLVCNLRDPHNPQTYIDDFLPAARAAACRDSLAATADLTRYGYPELAHDTEAVRRAFGYERLDLWGGSYGTRAAQVYLRMYPGHVGSMVLQGVAPPSFLQPRDYARDTDAALAGVLGDCRADVVCNAAFPAIDRELGAVAARLDSARGEGEILDPETGSRLRLSISRGDFAETLRRMLYTIGGAGMVPLAIHRAYEGDFRLVLRQALRDRRNSAATMHQGMYLALTCSEDVPLIDRAAAARTNGSTLLGDYRVRQQADACTGWPTYTPPAGYYEPVRSDVPVLLLSGQWDPVTPPGGGEEVLRTFPNGLHVVVPHGGHGYEGLEGSGCMDAMMVRFFRERSVRRLQTECVQSMRRPPFAIDLPEAVAVDQAALERLAGTYVSASPRYTMRMEVLDGALRVRGDDITVLALPLSTTRFFWDGLPGYELEFSADASALTLHTPREQFTLIRQP